MKHLESSGGENFREQKHVRKCFKQLPVVLGGAALAFFTFLALKSIGGSQLSISRSGTNVSLSFNATAGWAYQLQRERDLTISNWADVPGSRFSPSSNSPVIYTDTNALVSPQNFYRVKETALCDAGLASNSSNPADYAKAMDICQTTTAQDTNWGLISATFTLTSGTGTPDARSRSIRPSFGSNNIPRAGSSMVVLSTGAAAAKGQANPSYVAFQPGLDTGTSSVMPSDWLAANGNAVPNAPGCPAPSGGTTARNPIMLTLKLRVPHDAHSFAVSAKFFTSEFPEYVCSPYNDVFVVLLDSTYAGTPANPTDKNIAVYNGPNSQKYIMSVNLVQAGFLTQCVDGHTGCASGSVAGTMTGCISTAGLAGTGMDDPDSGSCDSNSLVGGGTDWVAIRGNVVPDEVIMVRFAIWDTSDGTYDSLVLLDNFRWSTANVTPGMIPE
jgi:hypothetical protein